MTNYENDDDGDDKILVAVSMANNIIATSCIQHLLNANNSLYRVRAIFPEIEDDKDAEIDFKRKLESNTTNRLEIVTNVNPSKPESLKKAFQGAHSALIITPFDLNGTTFADAAQLDMNMICEAAASNLNYLLFVNSFVISATNQAISSKFNDCQRILANLGRKRQQLNWTIINAGFFMQNLLFMFDRTSMTLRVPLNFRASLIDMRDVGKLAAQCLIMNDGERNEKCYDLIAASEVMNAHQIVNVLREVLQRDDIRLQELDSASLDTEYPARLAEMCRFIAQIDFAALMLIASSNQKEVASVDKIQPITSLKQFIIDHKEEFQ